jgi:integrase
MLSELRVRTVKPAAKRIKLFDERGLYLEVAPKGGKWWRLKYRYGGKDKRLSLGVYPDVGLAAARERRDAARKLLADGVDPGQRRKENAANNFEAVAREWFGKFGSGWAPGHQQRAMRLFERDIFPLIGTRSIAELKAPDILTVIRRIELRDAVDTAHRALGSCSQVFRYGVATGRCESDPSRDLRGALPPKNGSHFAATIEPTALAGILRAMDGYEGTLAVRCALRLAPLVFVRPGELRHAEWKDIDLEGAQWSYMVTKTKTPHIVPLSTQAVAILRELHPVTAGGRYVFPGARTAARPMSDNTILAAMRRLGIGKEEMCGHGLRAVARTTLDEVLGVRPDFIEHQLAHAVRDPNGRAYNRTAHLVERRLMMQQWSDHLDALKAK